MFPTRFQQAKAQNTFLLQQNANLRRQFSSLQKHTPVPQFQDISTILQVLQVQRSRIHFLRSEIIKMNQAKQILLNEKLAQDTKSSPEQLESRLQSLQRQKLDLQSRIQAIDLHYSRRVQQLKQRTSKQKAELSLRSPIFR